MSWNLCIFANSKYLQIMDNNDTSLLASSGDYRRLVCYQKARVVYDLTYWFCSQYMERAKDRSVDQMVQATWSGKQNIVEGITGGAASKESAINTIRSIYSIGLE